MKAQLGALSAADEAELASYRGVGRLLELMRSKADLEHWLDQSVDPASAADVLR